MLEKNQLIGKAFEIKIYGAARCHKSQYYQQYFADRQLPYHFLDVEENEEYAAELRSLYESGKLNFPTLIIDGKKLRNPNEKQIEKQLQKRKKV